MRFFNKDLHSKAQKRVAKMEDSALAAWMDSTLMTLHGAYDQYRFHNGGKEYVTEALTALNAIWDELEQR